MFRSSEFGRLCSAAKRDIRVVRGRESNKNFIRRGKRRGIRRFDKTTKRNGGVIGPERGNMFVILCPFCEMDSGGILLTSFEVGFGSVSTLPLGIDGERARRGAITEHNLWLSPINMWVMLVEPGVSKDNVVVS